jgi:hypothetical protein
VNVRIIISRNDNVLQLIPAHFPQLKLNPGRLTTLVRPFSVFFSRRVVVC